MIHDILKSVLLIGFGSIGKRHFDVLKTIYPECEITLVSRHEPVSEHNYKDIASVPDLSEFDYYIIASKTIDHYSHLSIIDRNVQNKKILVEKPLFSAEIEYFSEFNSVYVGYNLRYHPVLRKLKEILPNRRVLFFSASVGQYLPGWRRETDYRDSYSARKDMGGGVLLDLSHEIDYLQWLCDPILEVKGMSRKISSLEIDSDDFTTMIGVTEAGVLFNLTMDYLSRETKRGIHIQCDESTICCDLIKGSIIETFNDGCSNKYDLSIPEKNYTYSQMHVDIIEKNAVSACSLSEALSVMNAIQKIRKSTLEDWLESE